jgi:hypothetical protein
MNRLDIIAHRQRSSLTMLTLFALLIALSAILFASGVGPALR